MVESMDSRDFPSYVMNKKKELVLNTVGRLSEELGITPPSVNFDGCVYENDSQLAHIHLDTHVICISERQLDKHNFDDIQATITHEISHEFVPDHSSKFKATERDIKTTTWKPPGGVTVIKGGKAHDATERVSKQKKVDEPEPPLVFDPYYYCTDEFNRIYGALIMRIGSPTALVKFRHINQQLVDDDWKSDLVKHLDRKHEELMSDLGNKSAFQIFEWVISIKELLEQYNHWYWEAANEFFNSVCNSSLSNYLSDTEVESIMNKINSKLGKHVERLNEEIASSTKRLESLAQLKINANNELSSLSIKIQKKNDEMDALTKRQDSLNKQISELGNKFEKEKTEYHHELKMSYDKLEKQMKLHYDELEEKIKENIKQTENEKKDKEKELNKILERNKIANFIDSLFGGKKK